MSVTVAAQLLLHFYHDHPLVGPTIDKHGADIGRVVEDLVHGPWESLSQGERTYFMAALAIWNGHRQCQLADILAHLDKPHLAAIVAALALARGIEFPAAIEVTVIDPRNN